MRHLRGTVLATLAVGLCAAPIAAADHRHEHSGGAVVAPARGGGMTGGELLGEDWARGLVRPSSPDPFAGRCRPFVSNVLTPAGWEISTCTVTQRTRLFIFFGSITSQLDPPFSTGYAEQLANAVAVDRQAIHAMTVTVDGRVTNIRTPRFELFSPQRTVQLLAGNFYDAPAGTVLTFTAHAWGAVIRKLRPGRHTVTMGVVADYGGGLFTVTRRIDLYVVRGGGSGEDDDD